MRNRRKTDTEVNIRICGGPTRGWDWIAADIYTGEFFISWPSWSTGHKNKFVVVVLIINFLILKIVFRIS